jgi:hypothetical protein
MMGELLFWKSCCERGITTCQIPKPFKEESTCWLVEKKITFKDRKTWVASHTFDSDEEMFAAVENYLTNGNEPEMR